MRVDHALHQLSEIHAQLLRSEVFRGYRSDRWPGRPCWPSPRPPAQATVRSCSLSRDRSRPLDTRQGALLLELTVTLRKAESYVGEAIEMGERRPRPIAPSGDTTASA